MAKELKDFERAIVMQVVLDRWNPHRLTSKIANHFGLSTNQGRKSAQEARISSRARQADSDLQG